MVVTSDGGNEPGARTGGCAPHSTKRKPSSAASSGGGAQIGASSTSARRPARTAVSQNGAGTCRCIPSMISSVPLLIGRNAWMPWFSTATPLTAHGQGDGTNKSPRVCSSTRRALLMTVAISGSQPPSTHRPMLSGSAPSSASTTMRSALLMVLPTEQRLS